MPAALLFLLALAAPPESDPVRIARDFLDAYRAKSPDRQAILAAQKVPYALVVDQLLRLGEEDAARALAGMRGGETAGLQRLCKAYRRPTPEQVRGLGSAEVLIRRGLPDEALVALARAGEPVEGTVFGVQISWTRARALAVAKQTDASVRELVRCAKLAWACGWIHKARDAEGMVARRAPQMKTRLSAADRYVDACERIDDEAGSLQALELRGRLLRFAASKAAKQEDRVRLWKRMRVDYDEAIDVAQRLGRRREEALLRAALALHWQVDERQPRQSLKLYESAETILAELKLAADLAKVRLNMAGVMTQLGRHDDAIVLLDRLLRADPAAPVRADALARRAYALHRRGSLEKAAAGYRAALALNPRPALLVEAGEVQLQRGDLREADRLFAAAMKHEALVTDALVGRARVRGRRGDGDGARTDFAAARARVEDPNRRLRIVMLQVVQERSEGRIKEALALLQSEIATFADSGIRDFPNAGVAYLVGADLALLLGEHELAAKMVANGGTLFMRLNQPAYVVPAYAREVLLGIVRNEREDALMRLQVLVKNAAAVTSLRLKAIAKCAEAIFEARAGRPKQAVALLDEAYGHADRGGDPQMRATALVHKALMAPDEYATLVDRALAELDAIRVHGAEDHPLLEGERADHAPGIGLHMELKQKNPSAANALRWIERAKADRLQVAMRGREALLAAALPVDLHRAYIAARGKLMEARAEKIGVAEAEAGFDAAVAHLRNKAPEVAALAFPQPVDLAAVQAKLRKDEALVLMLEDPYARAILAIDRTRAQVATYDPKRPLDAVSGVLAGKRVVIAAPDGIWAARPLASAPFDKGIAFDRFRFCYVASAASFVRLQPAPAVKGLVVVGNGPAAAAGGKPEILHLGVPGRFVLDHPQASRLDRNAIELIRDPHGRVVVVAPDTRPLPAPVAKGEGVASIVAALRLGGAAGVIVSLAGPPPAALQQRFYANCLDKGLSPALALHEAQQWARRNVPGLQPSQWGGLVYYGLAR